VRQHTQTVGHNSTHRPIYLPNPAKSFFVSKAAVISETPVLSTLRIPKANKPSNIEFLMLHQLNNFKKPLYKGV
jgi:hypothetical protein